jgi:hypothetical protein
LVFAVISPAVIRLDAYRSDMLDSYDLTTELLKLRWNKQRCGRPVPPISMLSLTGLDAVGFHPRAGSYICFETNISHSIDFAVRELSATFSKKKTSNLLSYLQKLRSMRERSRLERAAHEDYASWD